MPSILGLTPKQFKPLAEQALLLQAGDDEVRLGNRRTVVQEAIDKANTGELIDDKDYKEKIRDRFTKWQQ